MAAPTSFATVQDVVNIQNNVASMISGQKHSQWSEDVAEFINQIKINEISILEGIEKSLKTQEQAFYNSIGMNYKELFEKTKAWCESTNNAFFLKDKDIISNIQKIIKNNQFDLQNLANQFENRFLTKKEMVDIFGEEIKQFIGDSVSIVSSGLQKLSGQSKGGTLVLTIQSQGSIENTTGFLKGQTGITKGITFFSSKNNPNQVQIRFTGKMPVSSKVEIQNNFNKLLNDNNKNTKTLGVYEEICNTLINYLNCTGPLAMASIEKVVKNFIGNSQDIAINQNTSVIRGALGEIYWNAFFDYLGIPAKPVGFKITDSYGKQLPVDILVENFGFQVKNYTSKNGIVTFNQHFNRKIQEMVPNTMSLSKFFSSNLELGSAGVENFGRFYFSREYNVQNKEKDTKNKFSSIYNRFATISSGIFPYVEANIYKLLNMNKSVQISLLNTEVEWGKPIMFLINDKPVPASEMISNIRRGLESDFNSDTVYIRIRNLSFDLSSFQTDVKWDEEIDPAIGSRMKSASISYIIEVNVDQIINDILSHSE